MFWCMCRNNSHLWYKCEPERQSLGRITYNSCHSGGSPGEIGQSKRTQSGKRTISGQISASVWFLIEPLNVHCTVETVTSIDLEQDCHISTAVKCPRVLWLHKEIPWVVSWGRYEQMSLPPRQTTYNGTTTTKRPPRLSLGNYWWTIGGTQAWPLQGSCTAGKPLLHGSGSQKLNPWSSLHSLHSASKTFPLPSNCLVLFYKSCRFQEHPQPWKFP